MAPTLSKKRKLDDMSRTKTVGSSRKSRKQTYHSSPSHSPSSVKKVFAPVLLKDSDKDVSLNHPGDRSSSPLTHLSPASQDYSGQTPSSSASEGDSDSESSTPDSTKRKIRKANDPAVFSNSIAKILGSKLSTSKRADPVLACSATAREANQSISNSRLEAKAKHKLREEKRRDFEKGRVKEVLLGTDALWVTTGGKEAQTGHQPGQKPMTVGELQEQEKRLRKTAQRGVVKLFNAVRAAQVKGEEAAKNAKSGGRDRKQERIGEMSKQGFLELVAGGGNAANV